MVPTGRTWEEEREGEEVGRLGDVAHCGASDRVIERSKTDLGRSDLRGLGFAAKMGIFYQIWG